MSVTLVSGGSSNPSLSGTTSSRGAPPSAKEPTPSAPTRATGISRDAVMLRKLKDLQTSQPARFRLISSEITAKLKVEADSQGGDVGQKLWQLADKFAEAARTGDMSGLRPSNGNGASNPSARGADAYRQAAARGSRGSDMEQIIADALKDMAKPM